MPGSSSKGCARAAMKPTKNETTEPLPSWSRGVGLPARTGSITSCKGEVEQLENHSSHCGETLFP